MDSPILIFESGVSAVTPGSFGGGWVSGNPATLGFGQSVNVVFDLGANWDMRTIVHIVASNTGPGTPMNVLLRSSDTSSLSGVSRALRDNVASALRPVTDSVTSAAAVGSYLVRPLGRFLIVQIANADAAASLAATAKVVVAAYPC